MERTDRTDIHDREDESPDQGHAVFLEGSHNEVHRNTLEGWADPFQIKEKHEDAEQTEDQEFG